MRLRNHGTRVAISLSLIAVPLLGACSGEETVTPTTVASTSMAPTSTAPTTSVPAEQDIKTNIESLSYLLQRLLTTKEIGGGWVDQGRNLVPPQPQSLRAGGLCPAGETLLAQIGTRLNDLVMVTYRKDEMPSTGAITEWLTWGPRVEIEADFNTLMEAHEACYGSAYVTPNGDSQKLNSLDVPSLGTKSFATHLAPGEAITDNPWPEVDNVTILLSDPSVDIAVVVSVTYLTVHEPGRDPVSPDVEELTRVARAAVEKNLNPP